MHGFPYKCTRGTIELSAVAYHPPIKTTLGGQRLSTQQLGEVRRRQEREQQLDAKYSGIQKKVSYVYLETHPYSLVVVHIYLQRKREEYQRAKRQKEDEELQRKKLRQREKVSLIYYSIVMLIVEIL